MFAEYKQSGGQMVCVYIPQGRLDVIVRRGFDEKGEFADRLIAVQFAKDLSDLINEHMNLSKYVGEAV